MRLKSRIGMRLLASMMGWFAVVVASFLVLSTINAASAESATGDDTARFLAGMQLSAASPLLPLTQDPVWRRHAKYFNDVFGAIDSRQLAKIRTWSGANLLAPQSVLFYMFSGPDFLYANAFFPNKSTYVLSGLEPTGPIPDLLRLPRAAVEQALRNTEVSLNSILANSFFKTNDMRASLRDGPAGGTIPLLFLFLARSGKTVREVSLIKLDEQGTARSDDEPGIAPSETNVARGVKIDFSGGDGRIQTLYYFSTNVANAGFKASGFAKFCQRLGIGEAFIKSASYLLHRGSFSDVRDFLLAQSDLVLQDDSGIPVSYFDGSWKLRPFGHYSGPISLFASRYQPKLTQLFRSGAEPIEFGIGYQSHALGSNLMIAEKSEGSKQDAHGRVDPAHPSAEVRSDADKSVAGPTAKKRKSAARTLKHKRSVTPANPPYPTSWFSPFTDQR
jgi:hypothetical protein